MLWRVLSVLSLSALVVACDGSARNEAQQEGDLLDAVMRRGTIRVALETIYRPGSFVDNRGNIVGFNPDVIEEVARRLGLRGVEYVEPSFEVIVAGNWQGRWDVAVHAITITRERQNVLLFTRPYVYADSYIVVHESNSSILDSTSDLAGKRIGTCAGCAQQRYLERQLELPGVDLVFHVQAPQVRPYQGGSGPAIEDLSLGDGVRLDAVLDEISAICTHRERGRPIKLVPDHLVMFSESSGIAFDAKDRRDATRLRDAVDRIIEEMHSDGTLRAISEKWFEGWDRTRPGGFPTTCGS